MTQYKIKLPFEGFYNSSYSQEVDYWQERETDYLAEEGATNAQLVKWNEKMFDGISWGDVYRVIAKDYVTYLRDALISEGDIKDFSLVYDEMKSPREYNFTTDAIYAFTDEATIKAMYAAIGGASGMSDVMARHTSRSGFISFYSDDISEWPNDVLDWDEIQLESLFIAYASRVLVTYEHDGLSDVLQCHRLMEDYGCSGELDNAIYQWMSKEAKAYDTRLRNRLEAKRA